MEKWVEGRKDRMERMIGRGKQGEEMELRNRREEDDIGEGKNWVERKDEKEGG